MRRLLILATLATILLGAWLMPGSAAAQGGDPCGDASTGVYPAGYEVVFGGNGGSGSQILLGGPGSDTLDGGSGNDILCGFGGDDTHIGGSGSDWLDGGPGSDVLRGDSGNDTLANGETNQGGSGNNEVIVIAPPVFLTVVRTFNPGGESFVDDVTGAGLQPGANVVGEAVFLDGGLISTITIGVVGDDGTFEASDLITICGAFASLNFSTIDRDGDPIATDEPVPC